MSSEQAVRPNKSNNIWKTTTIILAAVLMVLAITIIISLAKGLIEFKDNGSKVTTTQAQVCDNGVIDEFNKIIENTDFKVAHADLKNLFGRISTKDDFDQDPTCQLIAYWNYSFDDNLVGMKEAVENIVQLNERGLYINNQISNLFDITTLRNSVDSPRPETNPQETGGA